MPKDLKEALEGLVHSAVLDALHEVDVKTQQALTKLAALEKKIAAMEPPKGGGTK